MSHMIKRVKSRVPEVEESSEDEVEIPSGVEQSSQDEVEPPKKKQLPKRTCLVCDAEKGINQFPSPKRVSSHEHKQNICRPCYLTHLENEIDSKSWDEVACPECSITLTYREVKDMTSLENFAKYEQACVKATLATDPDFRYCFSTTCESGQLHPGGANEPIFRCQECGHKHCVACQANWHQDQTCEEFQPTLQRWNAENEQSQQEVEKTSKPCPKCSVPIQKNHGCDHMTCSRCHHEFCWICSVDHHSIFEEGNHRHEKSCTHYRAVSTDEEQEAEVRALADLLDELEDDDEENPIAGDLPVIAPTPTRTMRTAAPIRPTLIRPPVSIPPRTSTSSSTTQTAGGSRLSSAAERRAQREVRRAANRARRLARASGTA